jgi:hypothetical protein
MFYDLLPTPTSHQQNTKFKQGGICLQAMITQGLLPTPRANQVNGCNLNSLKLANRKKGNLEETVANWVVNQMLPTPVAGEYRDTGEKVATGNFKQMNLTRTIAQGNNQWTGENSQLNPQFVAEMMGFPTDWTILPFQNGETNP